MIFTIGAGSAIYLGVSESSLSAKRDFFLVGLLLEICHLFFCDYFI